MRHLAPLLTAVLLAGALVGCGKPQTTAPSAGSAPAAPRPSDAEKKAMLAKLPAPYNAADLENGEGQFALCASCHTLAQGGPSIAGPNLHGLFGRKTASDAKYSYSAAMKAANWTWGPENLDSWITNPKAALPGTKMTFAGMKDPKSRADVIAYLMVETGYKP